MTTLKNILFLSCITGVFFVFCGAPILKKEYLYIPIVKAQSGTGTIGKSVYTQGENTFSNVEDLSTVAFYKSNNDTVFKKAATNGIGIYSVKRQDLQKFKPNTDDILLMKTAFKPGYDYSVFLLTSYSEYAVADDYIKNINIDIANVKNGYYNMDFAIIALNVGNSTVKELKIFDVLPEGVDYVGSKYATKDDFIPLNANLAIVNDISHKVYKEEKKTTLVFDVTSSTGINPSAMVEILVNVNVKVPLAKN